MNAADMTEIDFSDARLIQLLPDRQYAPLLKQILERGDRVHDIPDMATLLTSRISPDGFNRQCFCLVDGDGKDADVLAAIYTELSGDDTNNSSPDILHGNIRDVLTTPPQRVDGVTKLVTCYSISSYCKGAGSELIDRLYGHFNAAAIPPVISTLSPIRTLGDFMQMAGVAHETDPEAIRLCAAAHLLQKTNGVQRFHQGKGAYIGAIHVFANVAGGKDNVNGCDVMVGYRYPRTAEGLRVNKADFKKPDRKVIPFSGALCALMKAASSRFAVQIGDPVDLSYKCNGMGRLKPN